jgi:filamin
MVDLSDGKLLCALLEIISSKEIKINKNPKMRVQKLENLTASLDFLKREGIKLVSIGADNICDGNRTLIMGLIWTIILRYQIQVESGSSAKKELLEWVRSKIPEYNINNFTSDWQSGKAICALAEAVLPGQMNLPHDFSNNPVADAQMGITRAKDNMSIPSIIDAEDMVQTPDELSNMTYISYFRDYLDMETRRREQELFERTPVAGKCFAYGKGLEPGNEAGIQTEFTIEARNGADRRVPVGGHQFPTTITAPDGSTVPVEVKDNNNGTYQAFYTPRIGGNHKVDITFQGTPIKNSPIQVMIKEARPDPTKCRCYGPGLEGGEAHEPARFTIEARNCLGDRIPNGGHPFMVSVKDPHGEVIPSKVVDQKNGEYACEYNPVEPGDYVVQVTLGGQAVDKSPYRVNIEENSKMASPFKSYAQGPGLEPGNKCTEPAHFTIHAVYPNGQPKKTGGDLFDVHIEDPNFDQVKAKIVDNGDGTWSVEYQPTDPGKYHIDVIQRNPSVPLLYDHVKNSPIDVLIDPGTVAEQCIAYGPGLEPGNLDTEPAHFTIEARDKNGNRRKEGGDPFKVEVQGPTGPVPVQVVDNGDGTYNVTYNPEDAGRHDIAVTLDGKPIKGSTFKVDIKPGAWAGKSVMEYFSFAVKTADKRGKPLTVGGAKIKAVVTKPNGQLCEKTKIQDQNNGTYVITYYAEQSGNYRAEVTIDGKNIVGSPFTQTIA